LLSARRSVFPLARKSPYLYIEARRLAAQIAKLGFQAERRPKPHEPNKPQPGVLPVPIRSNVRCSSLLFAHENVEISTGDRARHDMI
jgi:hypothetical protein